MIVLTTVTSVTAVTTVKKIFKKIYFLSTIGKSNLIHLTTDVMFSGQCFAILAMFWWRGCKIFLVERFRDFF